MYNSLKEWLNIPVKIKPFVKINGAGDKTYGTPVDAMCYVENKVSVTTDLSGNDIITTIQLFFDNSVSIKHADAITFDNKDYNVKTVNKYYRKGIVDMVVIGL